MRRYLAYKRLPLRSLARALLLFGGGGAAVSKTYDLTITGVVGPQVLPITSTQSMITVLVDESAVVSTGPGPTNLALFMITTADRPFDVTNRGTVQFANSPTGPNSAISISAAVAGYSLNGSIFTNQGLITGRDNDLVLFDTSSLATFINDTNAQMLGGQLAIYCVVACTSIVNRGTIKSRGATQYDPNASPPDFDGPIAVIMTGTYNPPISLMAETVIENYGVIDASEPGDGTAILLDANQAANETTQRTSRVINYSGGIIKGGTLGISLMNGLRYSDGAANYDINNAYGAEISATQHAISIGKRTVATNIDNAGTISAQSGSAIVLGTDSTLGSIVSVTNRGTGLISGAVGVQGIMAPQFHSLTIDNSGHITGNAGEGVQTMNTALAIVNAPGAEIKGHTSGVADLWQGFLLVSNPKNMSIVNSGNITGETSYGIHLEWTQPSPDSINYPYSITNNKTGLIAGVSGIYSSNRAPNINNAGQITGTGGPGIHP